MIVPNATMIASSLIRPSPFAPGRPGPLTPEPAGVAAIYCRQHTSTASLEPRGAAGKFIQNG